VSWRTLDATPSRAWVRFAPKTWPAAEAPYLDLAARRLAWPAGDDGSEPPDLAPPVPGDVVYLPPVVERARAWRQDLAARLGAAGSIPVVHDPGDRSPTALGAGWRLVDLTPLFLAGSADPAALARRLVESPARTLAVLPLVAGLTPAIAELGGWFEALAAAGASTLLAVAPELSPHDRRSLVGLLGDGRFEPVFHGRAPEEREVALAAAGAGLAALPPRPAVDALPPRAARNRELAARLAEAGELWLGLGRAEAEGSALLAAARHLETTHLDVAALAREGNLVLLDFLAPIARRVVEEDLERVPGGLLVELRALWGGKLAG